jgi:hypothetical protein
MIQPARFFLAMPDNEPYSQLVFACGGNISAAVAAARSLVAGEVR